ncbi:MAG: hypothetical protein ACRD9L_27780, partial [Bryobacteraceae bacterium]
MFTRGARTIVLFAGALMGRAEIVDRIAVTVANRVITESQILEAAHLTAFLNGEPADTSAAGKRKTADRLVEQILLRREMDLMHFSSPPAADVAPLLAQVKTRFKNEADFDAALRRSQISGAQLKGYLLWQLTTLRFIDFRFRPGVQVSAADLRAYYGRQLTEWQKKRVQPIPTF